jgi:hypothetical protein
MENTHLEEKIMEKIKAGQVKLKSRYIFLAEKLGLGSAFILSVILAVLFFSLWLFYLQTSDNLIYLSFGSRGMLAWLESFPYLLVISFTIFVILSALLFRKSEVAYKKPFIYFLLILLGFIIVAGGVLAATDMINRFEKQEFGGRMLRPLVGSGCACGNYGIAGRIIEVKGDWLALQTPEEIKKVSLANFDLTIKSNLGEGLFIVASGKDQDGYFLAKMIKIITNDEGEMTRHSVGKRFGQDFHRPLTGENLNTTTHQCFNNCLMMDKLFFECEHDCLKK